MVRAWLGPLFFTVTSSASGQLPPATQSRQVADTSVFAPLAMPTPNVYRTGGGKPGPSYWQNRADYDIEAVLDTATHTLSGSLLLHYENNSPDTLRFLWVQTEQNAFRDNSLNSLIFPQTARFSGRGFEGGDIIERFDQVLPQGKVAVTLRENGTMTRVDLAEPLEPGGAADFDVAWHFVIPEHGADLMGRDGSLYEIAQWYPRVAVYDDVSGWNTEPYLGQGEFYLEFGDFTLAITVPPSYIVAATGSLLNPEEVLTTEQRSRLELAAQSDTTIRIITAAELSNGTARPRGTEALTWRFAADNVRDAVWAAAPNYQWDASSYEGIDAFAYYRPRAEANWKEVADQARMSIEEYSERWFPYPWPQISAVEGPVSGMEYPMVAMEGNPRDVRDLYSVVTHEIGHMWFPMMVGSNERLYMWQDEGFDTFINTFAEALRYPGSGDQMERAARERASIEGLMRRGRDEPMNIQPDRVSPRLLGFSDYVKPSVGLQLLRQEILGPDMFDDSFREYVRRWAFKHPTPFDFFRTIEDVSGRSLDWFWRNWFMENATFDQTIDTVTTTRSGDMLRVSVVYGNRRRGVLPIRARFTFTDGTTQDFNYPAEVWSTNPVRYVRSYSFAEKQLAKIELDPDQRLIDVDRSDNVWTPSLTGR